MKIYTYLQICALMFIAALFINTIVKNESIREANYTLARDKAKGIAVHNFMLLHHKLDIPPEEAMYLNINANTYDVGIDDITMFITNVKHRGEQK